MDNIIERLAALMALASKDETRHHLCGINITPNNEDKEWILRVTDGHMGAIEPVSGEGLPELPGSIFIPRESWPVLKAAAKEIILTFVVDESNKALLVNGSHWIKYNTEGDLGKFPNLDAVYPKKIGVHAISFNAQYLATIQKALSNKKHSPVHIYFKDCSTPMTVKCDEREAVLMPCRGLK
jgi:DNA polymerase III sliding clamp (beta) subunit (PCNA family)